MGKIRKFTDKEVWDKILLIGGSYPEKGKKVFVAIQVADSKYVFNQYNDKIFLYEGVNSYTQPKFLTGSTGTTIAGAKGFHHYDKYNKLGCYVWKTDQYYEDAMQCGLHRGKMKAWRLIISTLHYRDGNKNNVVEQTGEEYEKNCNTNLHTCSYNVNDARVKKYVGGWSLGCIVANNIKWYYKTLVRKYWRRGEKFDLIILKEWT